MITLKAILEKCLFISIILTPFDGINIWNIASLRMGFIPTMCIGLIFLFTCKKSIKFSLNRINILLIIWVIYTFITIFINFSTIYNVEYKGRMGEIRALSIYAIFIFILLMDIYVSYILNKKENVILWISKGMQICFYIILFYSVFQFMGMMKIQWANEFISVTQQFMNYQTAEAAEGGIVAYRINGVSQEASTFATYMLVILPWLIINGYLNKRFYQYTISCILSILLLLLSYSRIACFGILLEMSLIYLLVFSKTLRIRNLSVFVLMILVSIGVIYLHPNILLDIEGSFLSFSTQASTGRIESNLTRFGLQYAALNIFMHNPIFGVGIGQFQFHAVEFLPSWSYIAIEIQRFMNGGDELFYGVFNTHLRVLAESGILGFMIWVGIAWQGMKNYLYILRHVSFEQKNIIKLIIISYIFSFISFINFDTYLFFYYWLLLFLSNALVYKIKRLHREKESDSSEDYNYYSGI